MARKRRRSGERGRAAAGRFHGRGDRRPPRRGAVRALGAARRRCRCRARDAAGPFARRRRAAAGDEDLPRRASRGRGGHDRDRVSRLDGGRRTAGGSASRCRDELAGAELLARGPKARGAIRASGLRELWSPDSESVSEVLDKLLERDLAGVRIAVQLHGEPLPDVVDALSAAGAEVVPVPVYRWAPPADPARLRRIVDAVVARQLDAVTLTSAPAVCGTLEARPRPAAESLPRFAAHSHGGGLRGPVTAAPLQRLGVPVVMPERFGWRAGARAVPGAAGPAGVGPARRGLPAGASGQRRAGGRDVRALPPAPLAVLRALAEQPGRVLSRAQLRTSLPRDGSDAHAVEIGRHPVARAARPTRASCRRGYRLAYEPEQGSGTGACS